MAAVLAGLKSVDFYRKLKKDLQQVAPCCAAPRATSRAARARACPGSWHLSRPAQGCCTGGTRDADRARPACCVLPRRRGWPAPRACSADSWGPEQELTEASFAGAALSVCAAIFMILLVIGEFSTYMSVTTESKVVLDHFDSSADDTLQVSARTRASVCVRVCARACAGEKRASRNPEH